MYPLRDKNATNSNQIWAKNNSYTHVYILNFHSNFNFVDAIPNTTIRKWLRFWLTAIWNVENNIFSIGGHLGFNMSDIISKRKHPKTQFQRERLNLKS